MAKKITRKRLFIKIAIGVFLVFLIGAIYLANSFSYSAQKWFDRFYACQSEEVSQDIVVVEIDDASLQAQGIWPWSREITAELLTIIEQFQPAKIGVDINLVEESRPEADLALQSVLDQYENIYLPIEAENLIWNEEETAWLAGAFLRPYYFLNSQRLGHINFINSKDNIVRQIPGQIFDHRNMQGYQSFTELLAEKNWPSQRNQIYFCPAEYFQSISAETLFDEYYNEKLRDLFAGKIVLIGLSSADLHDYVYTPISQGNYMFGIYLHANALNTLLSDKTFHNLNPLLELAILLCFLFLYLFYLLFTENYTVTNLIVAVLLSLGLFVVNMLFFDVGILFNGWYFLLGIIVLYLYVLMVHYVFLYVSKQDLRKLFSFYLSEAILADLIDNPEALKLGGVRKEMTVLFSDLRGFTSLSESLSPEDLVSVLNKYLSEMTSKVFEFNGVIDKYMGDAIMSFWGAPLDDAKQVENAAAAALAMRDHLKALNKQKAWIRDDIELHLGIGINTGPMIVGNMGGEQRFDYTVMGDSVNLGSRLEALNKIYGTEIILSEFSYKKIKDVFSCRLLDKVAVKGKEKPVRIYELVGFLEKLNEKQMDEIRKFNEIVELYLNKEFAQALEILKTLDKDRVVEIYIERCEAFLVNPPREDWDGVFVLKTK